jgi:hypothetical protein
LLRLALWPKVWLILEKVPWDAENSVYYVNCLMEWNIL